MPTIETIIAVAAAGIALSLSPGPSMLYVLSRSVGQSRAAGLASALGLGLGGVLLALVAAFGLATIYEQSQLIYRAVTILGALYILYLGITMIYNAEQSAQETMIVNAVEQEPLYKIVYQGVLVEALNPKTVLFFMAFIPPFVDVSRSTVTLQLLILGILVPLTALPSDLVIAFAGGSIANLANGNPKGKRALTWVGGLVLMGLGLRLFFV